MGTVVVNGVLVNSLSLSAFREAKIAKINRAYFPPAVNQTHYARLRLASLELMLELMLYFCQDAGKQ